MLRLYIIVLLLYFMHERIMSQDYLRKLDGTVLRVIIKEVTDSSIVYQIHNDEYGLVYETNKSNLEKIYFSENASGIIDVGYKYWDNAPKNSLKVGLTSVVRHTLQLGVERLLTPKLSMEFVLHYHTILDREIDELFEVDGFGLSLSAKYRPWRNSLLKMGKGPETLLHGTYLQPSIYYSDREEFDFVEFNDYWVIVGGMQIGYVFTLYKNLNIDVYGGIHGYTGEQMTFSPQGGFSIPSKIELNDSDFSGEDNFAVSFGVKVGYFLGR